MKKRILATAFRNIKELRKFLEESLEITQHAFSK